MDKPKAWKGNDLAGEWLATVKIDGVQARLTEEGWVSRAEKPLYNIPTDIHEIGTVVEVFYRSWEDTISLVRSKNKKLIRAEDTYELWPDVDCRLVIDWVRDPSSGLINKMMLDAVASGNEGLVLRGEAMIKVKPEETYDVPVLDTVPGKGRHEGRVGALVTPMGRVGTGLSDEDRELSWDGAVVEVRCMGLTPGGKFRHPRLVRRRYDKEV